MVCRSLVGSIVLDYFQLVVRWWKMWKCKGGLCFLFDPHSVFFTLGVWLCFFAPFSALFAPTVFVQPQTLLFTPRWACLLESLKPLFNCILTHFLISNSILQYVVVFYGIVPYVIVFNCILVYFIAVCILLYLIKFCYMYGVLGCLIVFHYILEYFIVFSCILGYNVVFNCILDYFIVFDRIFIVSTIFKCSLCFFRICWGF